MKNRLLKFIVIIWTAAGIGCATLVDGTSQNISVTTNVEKAEVFINGNRVGLAPWTGSVAKKKDTVLMVRKDGYKDEARTLGTKTPGIFWGNIIFGGFLGSTTDMVSGAAYEYSPGAYDITMEPLRVTKVDSGRIEKENEIRNFILASYPNILKGLSRGESEPLTSLLGLLEVATSDKTQGVVILKLQEIAKTASNAPSFADAVIAHFRKKTLG